MTGIPLVDFIIAIISLVTAIVSLGIAIRAFSNMEHHKRGTKEETHNE